MSAPHLDEDIERLAKQTFIQESGDLLVLAEEGLLALERDPNDAETVARIFRVAHTFKGSALSVGYQGVGRFSHWFEAVLDLVRRKETAFDDVLAGACLRALDLLKEEIEGLRVDPAKEKLAEADADFLKSLLETLKAGAGRAGRNGNGPPGSDPSGSIRGTAGALEHGARKINGPTQAELDEAAQSVRRITSGRAMEPDGIIGHSEAPLYKLFGFGSTPLPALEPEFLAFERMVGETGRFEGGAGGDSFAGPMLDALRAHPAFVDLKRACVARWVGLTKRLNVIDSDVRGDEVVNTMPRGYSCYVRNGTSLLSLEGSCVRIYGDSGRILEQYREERQLPQRSLRRVHLSGLRSGLCLPLRLGGRVAGFLFLNSSRYQAFDALSQSGLQVLSNARRLAETYAFDKGHPADSHYVASFEGKPALDHAAFDEAAFAEALAREANRPSPRATTSVESDPGLRFLHSPENTAYAIVRVSRTLAGYGAPTPPLHVRVSIEPLDVRFHVRLDAPLPLPWRKADPAAARLESALLGAVASMCGFTLRAEHDGFSFLLERDDPAEGLDYSC